jgi:hypothetical protein
MKQETICSIGFLGVQVCDATGDDRSTTARDMNIFNLYFGLYFAS